MGLVSASKPSEACRKTYCSDGATTRTRGVFAIVVAVGIALSGCNEPPPEAAKAQETNNRAVATPQPSTTASKTPAAKAKPTKKAGNFFDDSKVFKDTTNPQKEIATVPCVGAKDGEPLFHPQKIRGTVWAPFGKYASYKPHWLELMLSGEAHAHPLAEEKPVAGHEVTLQRVDGAGTFIGEPILKATTDEKGRYCMRLPDGVKVRTDLVVYSGEGDTLIRRNVASRSTNDIFLQPEALYQILLEHKVDLTKLPRREFGNLYSLTDTIVDVRAKPPLKLQEGATIKPSIAQVKKRMLADERFMEKLSTLKQKYGRTAP